MKEERKKGIAPPANIGISMLLVVFLILCLFTFSTIALVQAQNEYDNAVRSAGIRSRYYEAVMQCESELHELNKRSMHSTTATIQTIDKDYPLSDDMVLSVTFTLVQHGARDYYHITKFVSTSTAAWSGDDKLNLVQ